MADLSGTFEVAIAGVNYRAVEDLHKRRFLDVIRQQADASAEPTEASLNPNDLWRRSQDSWILGAGQEVYDDEDGERRRFNSSEGIDPWDKGEIKLLKSVSDIGVTGTPTHMVVADGYVWIATGTTLERWDGATFTTTGAVPQTIVHLGTDGTNVYIASNNGAGAGGLYWIQSGSTTPSLLNNVIPDIVEYASGRLMVGAGINLYNITDTGSPTIPTPLATAIINDSWQWTAIGSGQQYIYAGGNAGDHTLIYRITIQDDGSGLTSPVVASQLPDGEHIHSISSYLGYALLGTQRGLRLATIGDGLTYGSLIPSDSEVHAIEPQGRFVWFGRDGGLIRCDLSRFVNQGILAAAYANDLASGSSGTVTGAVTWNDRRLFLVSGIGVFYEDASTYVTSGYLRSGRITYRLPDTKQAMFLDVRASIIPDSTSIQSSISFDSAVDTVLGTQTLNLRKTYTLSEEMENSEVVLTLSSDGVDTPVVTRFVLRALPTPKRTEQVEVIIDLRAEITDMNGVVHAYDVWSEFERLQDLVRTGELVTYQEFSRSYTANIENVQLGPDLDVTETQDSWEGYCKVTLKIYEE